jgi:phospholipid/cholesterol/gamma-HCH transport system substrate-binding protein
VRRSWAVATVGALVLIVGVISYMLVKSVKDSPADEGYAVWANFKDAAGLFQKSRVQTAGIPVGQIEKRELDPERPVAKITIRIVSGMKIYDDAMVSKKSASLLGEFYLEIDPGTPFQVVDGVRRPRRQLGDGDQIKRVNEPTAMADLMDNVGTILPILRQILEDVRRLTGGPIANAAQNIDKMIETNSKLVESLLTKMDHIAGDVENITSSEGQNIRIAIENVRDITESVKKLVGTSEGEVEQTGTKVRSSLDKLQATIDNLDKSLKNMEKVTGRLEKGEGTVGHLLADDTIARNVEEITDDAGGFLRGITKLQTIVGLRTEYNFLSSSFKEYLSIQLVPKPDKFYLIEIVDDPRGFRERTTSTTVSSRTGYERTDTTSYSEKLRFTLQFGKRYGFLTGRFGIKESTGGAGLDFHLLKEKLLLSVDVFDTRFNRYPRVQARLMVSLYRNNLYILGGVDDVINERATLGAGGGFDWFLGGQLQFNDEDLKTLLLFGGGAAAGSSK